jgi:hypothetical protein
MDDWNIRDQDEMDALRDDLLECPVGLHYSILADFMKDPVVAFGFKLRERILQSTAGTLFFDRRTVTSKWRDIVENVVPSDGRHPDGDLLERFLTAAERAGWCDPRLTVGPSFSQT